MSLKTFKPYTKSTRGTVIVNKSGLWKGSPYKPLTKGQKSTGGRNNYGRITSRHRGGGVKHKYRIIDFLRNKSNISATIERIEYDPNRTSYIALIKYEDEVHTSIFHPYIALRLHSLNKILVYFCNFYLITLYTLLLLHHKSQITSTFTAIKW